MSWGVRLVRGMSCQADRVGAVELVSRSLVKNGEVKKMQEGEAEVRVTMIITVSLEQAMPRMDS